MIRNLLNFSKKSIPKISNIEKNVLNSKYTIHKINNSVICRSCNICAHYKLIQNCSVCNNVYM